MVQGVEVHGPKRATSAVIQLENAAKFSDKDENETLEKTFKTVNKSQLAPTPIAEESSQNRNTPIKSHNGRHLASS